MIKEFPKVKRMVVGGESVVIKVDLIINKVIYLEKDVKKSVYNFYFPSDAPNNIYMLGCSIPVDVLDGFEAARFQKLSRNIIDNVLKNKPLPDLELDKNE